MIWVVELEQQRREAQNRRVSLTTDFEPSTAMQSIPQATSISSFDSTLSEAMSSTTNTVPVDHYLDRHWVISFIKV